jgi:creatinine amidohydrolase
MEWSKLTSPDFARAVKDTGVCVLAIGCLEKHFDHLPLGTDYINAYAICTLAAEKEPAVVFPPYYFGQINEARPFPGTVAIEAILTLQLLGNVCDEIGRNGFRKIVIYNGHGGNGHMLNYFAQCLLAGRKPYTVYVHDWMPSEDRRTEWDAILESVGGHADECETSITMANCPGAVKPEYVKGRKHAPLKRLSHMPRGYTPIWWYADNPDHYRGDATLASEEKGIRLRDLLVDTMADYIRAVKADSSVTDLTREFYDRSEEVGR